MCRFFILFLCYFVLKPDYVQSQIYEHFNDSAYQNIWVGNISKFNVVNNYLRSNSTLTNDTFYISTASSLARIAQWEFYINLKFNTSGTNYADVFLVSDIPDLKSSSKNGYFVRIGGTSDEICLYRRKNGANTKLIDGINTITNTSNNTVKIKVTRSSENVWTLKRDITGTGFNYVNEGSVVDSTYNYSSYFGLMVRQSTTSFHLKHFFDDIKVEPLVVDTIAPRVLSLQVLSPASIRIVFNEYVDAASSENPDNYFVNNDIGHPESATRDPNNPKCITLTFSNPFTDSITNTLAINGVKDFDDNILSNALSYFTYYAPVPVVFKDLVINELFADPSPVVNLPEAEFVEIYNRSNKRFSLKNWQLADNTTSAVITTTDDSIYPGDYIIICSSNDSLRYTPYGRVLAMDNFPALNNTSDVIYLKTASLDVCDSVNYKDSWYKSTSKKQGGWTLECISPDFSLNCNESDNWIASNNPAGGSPGLVNSVYKMDVTLPGVTEIEVILPDKIILTLNKPVDTLLMKNVSLYHIDNGGANPLRVETDGVNARQISLYFSNPLKLNTRYHLTIYSGFADCFGNAISDNYMFSFAVPQEVEPNDLVINEILADPKEGGVDFIEIYNRSGKIINLKKLFVAEYDTIHAYAIFPQKISTSQRMIFPREYLVISKNQFAIKSQYAVINSSVFIDITSMPKMNIASGAVCLVSSANGIIDVVKYDNDMHYPLIQETKGVSLERIDFNQPSDKRSNWHSASQNSGNATPGYENSQYINFSNSPNQLIVYPELFSPDEDGIDDVLGISYNLKHAGYKGTITVYDSNGRMVKNLVKNELLGANGVYIWDGTNDNREKARIGIYVVLFEAFDIDGDVIQQKKVCVVGGKI